MRATQRFLEYASIWTSSQRGSKQSPSSMRQFDLAHQLAFELKEMGLSGVTVDNHCFVYGHLPPTPGQECSDHIGFIAHLDTYPDCPGNNVAAQIVENYDGGAVSLGSSGLTLDPERFPHLPTLAGQTLITTDGTTLLGADDKAGIAEIMTAVERAAASGRPHGPVSVAFMPDEELGIGTAHFDIPKFAARYAYTVDGWEVGQIVAETFNAKQAVVRIKGVDAHSGRAKGIMRNAQLVAMELAAMLPPCETPAETEGRDGFFHLLHSQGTVRSAELVYNLRDFSQRGMERRVTLLTSAAERLNRKYGPGTVEVSFSEQYRNMNEKLSAYPQLVERAINACERAGIAPTVTASRGGTDGARLSFQGLPCPNLGIGGWAYHSLLEHITAERIEQVAVMLEELIYQFAG